MSKINDELWIKLKFRKVLHRELLPYLKYPTSKRELSRLRNNLNATIIGRKVKTKPVRNDNFKIDERLNYLQMLLQQYLEIQESLLRIKMSGFFISQYLSKKLWIENDITNTNYIRYHFEVFLNEVYVTRERMVALLKVLQRKCKKKKLIKETNYITVLINDFIKALNNISSIRGKHIHLKRWTDTETERFMLLELLSDVDAVKMLKELDQKKYSNEKSKTIKDNYKAIIKLIDTTLNHVEDIIFIKLMPQNKQ